MQAGSAPKVGQYCLAAHYHLIRMMSKISLAPPPAMMAELASDADAKGPYGGRKGVASQFQENYSQKASAYASPSLTLP